MPSDSLTLEAELGRVPSFATFELEKPSGRLQVPLDEVETVTWRNPDGDVVTCVLLFAGVVALVGVIVIASSLNHLGEGCAMASAPSVRTCPVPPAPSPGS